MFVKPGMVYMRATGKVREEKTRSECTRRVVCVAVGQGLSVLESIVRKHQRQFTCVRM